MTHAHAITAVSKYGAAELKLVAKKYMMYGLLVGTITAFSGVGTYYLVDWLVEEEEPVRTVRILKYTDLGPPPSLTSTSSAPVGVSQSAARPSVGIPVPVPDAEVSPDATIASMDELSRQPSPVLDMGGSGEGGGATIVEDLKIEEEPADFVPFEKEPVAIKRIEPKYPELALKAGLEGNVYVRVWVDKEGKVRKAVVQKSDAPIFDEAAREAAMQWVFTPALMQNGPVSVWVVIPFRFRLTGNK